MDPGAHVQLQVAWGCDGHADAVAGGRSQWRLLGECKPPQGDRCEDSATHVAIMTETDKNTIVSAATSAPTHAAEVEQQRVDSIVPDYPPGD